MTQPTAGRCLLALVLVVVPFTLVPGAAAEAAFPADAFATIAGDLDADGGPDLLVQSGGRSETFTVTALRGADGSTSWTTSIHIPGDAWGSWNYATPRALGPAGAAGVLVEAIRSSNGSRSVHLAALGSDGTQLWRRGETPPATTYPLTSEEVAVHGVVRVDGDADDVLVGRRFTLSALVVALERSQLSIVAGETGTVLRTLELPPGTAVERAVSIGDVTGDGLDDVGVVERTGASTALAAYRGFDLTRVWSSRLPVGSGSRIEVVPDATGDGRDDVALSNAGAANGTPNLWLIDGGDGRTLWSRSVTRPTAFGDADGDGLGDVLAMTESYSADPAGVVATLAFEAFDGAGAGLYRETRMVTFPLGGSSPCASAGPAGDADADGSPDVTYQVFSDCRYRIEAEGGIVSGRTGSVRWSARSAGWVLHATVDGDGDDLAAIGREATTTAVSAIDGRDGSTVWSSSVPGVNPGSVQSALAADLDGDGRAEVVPAVAGSVTALRGADGTILWTR